MLKIQSVCKNYGSKQILKSLSLEIKEREFVTLLGASGSGKTTLLRCIAGFEACDSGSIQMGDLELNRIPPYLRPVNTVFQHYALFPHLTVFENVAYGLRAKKVDASEIPGRVDEALSMVKMTEFASRVPAKMSGGQQQRVALARALVNRPRLLLLDEPLSALDANLRREMQLELKALQKKVGITFLFVTHDQEEAMALSDRIALLRDGQLEQMASPREIYYRPATEYVAQFIGQTNLIRAQIRQGLAHFAGLSWKVELSDGPATFSLRPEHLKLATPGFTSGVPIQGQIESRRFEGSTEHLEIRVGSEGLLRARVPSLGTFAAPASFEFQPQDAVLVSREA
jgi:spermidine/putrescine transport system ATP-binding protein